MIYSYVPYIEEGPNGFTLRHRDENQEMTEIGVIDSVVYVYSPTVSTQDERIGWSEVILDEPLKDKLRAGYKAKNHKQFARMKIEEIGDVYDLLADAMKLIEFNMMLTARLAGDLWGTHPIDTTTKATYADRNGAFLDAVSTGGITLRGDFDDMNVLMNKLMSRYSHINTIVRDHYVDELREVGLL